MRGEFEITDEMFHTYQSCDSMVKYFLDYYAKQSGKNMDISYGYYAYKYYSDRNTHHFRWADSYDCISGKLITILKREGYQTAEPSGSCSFNIWWPDPVVKSR